MNTVSIVLNNYNYARFLRQAIDSALGQTYPHCEVIVVDDGSTDGSEEIIRSYGSKIRAVIKENGGQASALNAGFAQARGEIIRFLDSDDYLCPTAVERIVSVWNDGVKILHHRVRIVDANGKELGFMPPKRCALDSGDVVPILLLRGGYLVPPTSGQIYSRSILQKLLPMPEEDFRICADTWLLYKAPFLAPITVLDEDLACYRHHDANAWAPSESRRLMGRRKIEIFIKFIDVAHALIVEQAAERGLATADRFTWEASVNWRFRLILNRLGSPVVAGQKRSVLVGNLIKAMRLESLAWPERVRNILLALMIWLAPRFVLRHMYPNIFNEPS
jgi:glycosyltransferase involved in cell wall biosynthesis